MATRTGGQNWAVIISGTALALTFVVNLLGFASRDTERLDKRVSAIENDLAWKYVTKEYTARDINFINKSLDQKLEKDIYNEKIPSIDRQINLLRERLKELDHSVNQTFNARDAYNSVQQRLIEIERQNRGPSVIVSPTKPQ